MHTGDVRRHIGRKAHGKRRPRQRRVHRGPDLPQEVVGRRGRSRHGAENSAPPPPARRPPPSATAETTQRGSSHCNEMTIFRTRGEHFAVKWPRYTKKAQVGFIAIPQIRPRNSDNRYFVPKRLLFERANRRRARLRCDRLNPRRASPSFAPALPSAPGLSFIFLEKFRGMRGVVA